MTFYQWRGEGCLKDGLILLIGGRGRGWTFVAFARMSSVSVETGNCYGGGELGKVRSQKRDDFIVVRGIEVGLLLTVIQIYLSAYQTVRG